jgi:hypothetical protein
MLENKAVMELQISSVGHTVQLQGNMTQAVHTLHNLH